MIMEGMEMARLHYYRFPEGVDPDVMAKNGAEDETNECTANFAHWTAENHPYLTCRFSGGGTCRECQHLKCTKANDVVGGISITAAKRLLKEFGGVAWTDHCERDGGCFETTEIRLKGNNSHFKYNHHL